MTNLNHGGEDVPLTITRAAEVAEVEATMWRVWEDETYTPDKESLQKLRTKYFANDTESADRFEELVGKAIVTKLGVAKKDGRRSSFSGILTHAAPALVAATLIGDMEQLTLVSADPIIIASPGIYMQALRDVLEISIGECLGYSRSSIRTLEGDGANMSDHARIEYINYLEGLVREKDEVLSAQEALDGKERTTKLSDYFVDETQPDDIRARNQRIRDAIMGMKFPARSHAADEETRAAEAGVGASIC